MRVTFDTNALNDIISPATSQRGEAGTKSGIRVRAAIEAGHVQGFFCETLVTLEGIQKKDRGNMLGSTRLHSQMASTAPNTIAINIGVLQDRKPLDPAFSNMVQAAKNLGLRALRAPAHMGWIRVKDEDDSFFALNGSTEELLSRMEKVNEMAAAIRRRGLGQAVPLALGLQFLVRDGISQPTLWFQRLRRAKSNSERQKVVKAVAEWADGDSVAAHYGYGIDLICSEDFGRNTPTASILDDANRAWLTDTFGIQFVTMAQLADMVTT
jgi:hypothetical protein